jgi:thiosulfate/3-mercaptopyruvate sulfurtransferase
MVFWRILAMFAASRLRNFTFWFPAAFLLLCAASALVLTPRRIRGDEKKSSDPWASSQTLHPGGLAGELADKNGTPPSVVYVGFRTLFAGGHIAGASFHGTASTEQGLASLKAWADPLPRSTNLIIYCGCCPFDKCPNIRPAYTALSNMGFKKVRVLVLPTSFATDWVDKGYPIQKGM